MKCLPQKLSGFALAVAMFGSFAPAGYGQDAAPPAAPADAAPAAPAAPAAAPADTDLVQNIENLLHYYLIGNYTLAATEATNLVGRPDDITLVRTAERMAADRGLSLDTVLGRFRETPELKDVSVQLVEKLNKIRAQHVRDPQVINQNIDKLSGNQRERDAGLTGLQQAGEIAVPLMLDRLRDNSKAQQHPTILSALANLRGGGVVAPLIAATDTKDTGLLTKLADVLMELQYNEVVPYLVAKVEDPNASSAVRSSISAALARKGVNVKTVKAGDLFYSLAERYYYGTAAIRPDTREDKARLWFWDDASGLVFREVPPAVFGDVMAIRTAELAMKHNASGDAVSLWLAANNKREVEAPQGDAVYPYSTLNAHYWNVRVGAQHLNAVIRRAMNDGNGYSSLDPAQRSVHTLITLKAIKSLAEISGQSNLAGSQLIDAMRYPDRTVRYEAALALAGGLPQQSFPGQDRVIVLLGEALAQTGTPGLLIFANQPADVQKLSNGLKDKFRTAGGTNAAQVIAESGALPSIDAILIAEDVNPAELSKLLTAASNSARLDHAAKVVMVSTKSSPWFRAALTDQRLSATTATVESADQLNEAIAAGKKRAGGVPVDDATAMDYAMRSAGVMGKLAISRGQVLDLRAIEPTLLSSLGDARVELAKASAQVVGLLDSDKAQAALCDKAVDDKSADDLKIVLYKSLATNVKFYSGRLDPARIDTLRKAASNEKTAEVKSAAAEALGALNLTTEQVKPLILERPDVNPVAAPAQ